MNCFHFSIASNEDAKICMFLWETWVIWCIGFYTLLVHDLVASMSDPCGSGSCCLKVQGVLDTQFSGVLDIWDIEFLSRWRCLKVRLILSLSPSTTPLPSLPLQKPLQNLQITAFPTLIPPLLPLPPPQPFNQSQLQNNTCYDQKILLPKTQKFSPIDIAIITQGGLSSSIWKRTCCQLTTYRAIG